MSETTTQPRPQLRRVPAVQLNRPLGADELPEKIAWTVAFLQLRGWTSKRDAQAGLHQEMLAASDELEANTLPNDPSNNPYRSEVLVFETTTKGPGNLKAGPEFLAYIAALKAYEAAPIPRPAKVIDTLRDTAQGYLDHYADHPKFIQTQPQNLRKKMVCENTLAELRKYELRDEIKALGSPPWDSAKAMQAASVKATIDFESVSENAKAEVLGGNHAFPAFWVNKADETGETEKTYLFKPKSSHSGDGVPKGGETAREAAAGRLGDLLTGITGVNFGVPETHIVALPKNKFPEGALEKVEQTDPLVGSLQQYAKTDGDLRNQTLADRSQVPAAECEKIAVLDMLTLNLDRHAGNMLVRYPKDGSAALTPIDHGLTFPTPNATDRITQQLGDGFNATLALPGAHEPFSKEMQEGIDKIDPNALAAAMKTEVGVLGKAFPGVGDTISDASIEMSRRSAMFLKIAAPALSPAGVQVAFAQNATELLDPTLNDEDFTTKARSIILAAEGEQVGLAEYCCMTRGEQSQMEKVLRENGWPVTDRRWMLANPSKIVALYRGNVRNPVMMQKLEKQVGADTRDKLLKNYTLVYLYSKCDNPSEMPVDLSGMPDDQKTQQLEEIKKAFPNFKIAEEARAIVLWQKFNTAGGMKALTEAETKLKLGEEDKQKSRNSLETAVERIEWANSLVALSDDERNAKLDALEQALPDEKTDDRSRMRDTSEKIRKWDAIANFTFEDQKGFEAIKRAAVSLGQPIPTMFGGVDSVTAGLQDRHLVNTPEARQALLELDMVWKPKRSTRTVREQAIALAKWKTFNDLGGEAMLIDALKSLNLRRSDVDSVDAAIDKLELFRASNNAMKTVHQTDIDTQDRQAVTTSIAFMRQIATLNLPPDHPLHTKINEYEINFQAITGKITAEFVKWGQVLKITIVDGIHQVLAPRAKELQPRLETANKAAGIEAAEDSLAGRLASLAEEISGAQYDRNLLQGVAEVARGIQDRWEEGRKLQPAIGAWKPLAS